MAGDRRISRPDASLPDWEVPDSSYRPIPIVWFTGAMIAQLVGSYAIVLLLLNLHGAITVTVAAMLAGVIAAWTWSRGMSGASKGWKVSTIIMLVFQLILVGFAVFDRV